MLNLIFGKNMLNTPLSTFLTLFGYFHILTYQILKKQNN